MTLALYGKSRKRQGGLLLAALLAILVASIGGLSVITSAFAHTSNASATCSNARVDFTLFAAGTNSAEVSIAVDGGAPTLYNPQWSGASYVFNQPIAPANSAVIDVRWGPGINVGTSDNHASNPAAQTFSNLNCTPQVNIQIHKYMPGGAEWQNQGVGQGDWKYTIYKDNAGVKGAVIAANVDHLNPSPLFDLQTVWIEETNTDGDIFYGWFVPDGDNNSGNDKCNQAPADFTAIDPPDARYSTDGALKINSSFFNTTGNATGLYHICAYNNPAAGKLIVVKVGVDIPAGSGNANGTVSPAINSDAAWTAPFSGGQEDFNNTPNGTYTVVETGMPQAVTGGQINFIGFKEGTSTSECSTNAAEYTADGIVTIAGNTKVVCVLNKFVATQEVLANLRVKKVVTNVTDDATGFAGKIQLDGVDVAGKTFSGLVETDADGVLFTLPLDGNYTVVETPVPGTHTLLGYAKGTWVGLTCPAGPDPNYAGEVLDQTDVAEGDLICIYNEVKPTTRTIEVCKIVVDNGDGIVDGGKFAFAYDWKVLPTGQLFVGDATAPVEGGAAVCATFTAPVDKAVRITEVNQRPGGSPQLPGTWNGDDPLYPQNSYDGLGAKDNSVELPVGVNTVTFYNKTLPRTKEIVIEKHYVNLGSYTPDADDLPTFTLSPDPFDGVGAYAVGTDHCSLDAGGIKWTCTVPATWIGTAAETLPLGWRESEGLCEATNNPVGLEHFAFCNEPYGIIRIEKFDSVNGTTGPLWDFTVAGNFAGPGGVAYINPAQADQGTPFVSLPIGLSNTPVTVAEVLAQSMTACTTANTYYTIATPPADTVINTPGETQTWTFENAVCGTLGTGGLVIEKYLDINGDGDANDVGEGPLSDWAFTTTGGGIIASDQVNQTDANGQILGYTGFDAGTVLTTTESAQAGYTLTRVTLDGTNVGTNASNDVVIVGGETRIIRYYNHPRGSISVHKTTQVNTDGAIEATPNDDDGWQFTLTSDACGITSIRTTNEAGNATFNNLPMCNDYVVTENLSVTGAAGYTPVGLTTVVNVTPGIGTATVITFVNEKTGFIPFVVPTPTPTIPTATPTTRPVEPTNTPVPPTATPTQTGIVAGEKTPGPASPTPIVPSTGNGVDGGASVNIVFIIVGLFAITTGMGAIALRSTRRR